MADKLLRRPPAYQVYAADDLAKEAYYGLSAGERGVLDSMQRGCWVEDTVPKNPVLLARVVRLDHSDLSQFLTPSVLAHFEPVANNQERLRSRELTRQMTNVIEVRERQRLGGKEGAKMTNTRSERPRIAPRQASGSIASTPAGRPACPELNRDEERREEQKQSLERDDTMSSHKHADWLRELREAEQITATEPPR